MPINSKSVNSKLFDLLASKGFNPKPLDVEGKVTPVPEEAAVIKFDFIKDGKNYGKVWASVDGTKTLQIYYGDDVANSSGDVTRDSDHDDTWTGLIKHLKNWAQRRQLGFDLRNENHLESDMARRKYSENIAESVATGIALTFTTLALQENQINSYAKKYFESHNIQKPYQKFISNVKRLGTPKLIESKEAEEIHHFIQALANVDSKKKIKIGDTFAVLGFEIIFAWREVGVFGFTEPKQVADIKLHSDGTITYIKFTDGDRYPRLVKATHNNKPIIQAVYFDNKNSAEKALTYLRMITPDNWDIDFSRIDKGNKFNDSAISENQIKEIGKDTMKQKINKKSSKQGVAESYWQDVLKQVEADREARKGKPFEKNPASHDEKGVYKGDKDLAGNPVPKRKEQGVEEGVDKQALQKELILINKLIKDMKHSWQQQHLLQKKEELLKQLKQGMTKGINSMEQVSEGYYPMGKQGSYSDAVPTTKIIIQHSRKIEEGEQRYRNIAKIFVENTQGERFAVPTTKPGIARVYARHIAEGGTPYDERGKHITSLVEEYQKMAGFVRATKNKQFNESAQQLVNEGLNHYQGLRETLHRMCGHRGYMAYFESYTPTLVEDGEEQNNLNELFVQETLDPRIESVMPILSRIHKKVSEMRETGELAEWADSLVHAAIVEDSGIPIEVRSLYAQIYAKYAKIAGAAKGAKQMAYAQVEKKYGKDMVNKLKAYHNSNEELDEELDDDQKHAGQLGPTEKVGPEGAVGKLVGANESVEQGVAEGTKQQLPKVLYKEISPDIVKGREFFKVVKSESPFWKVGETFSDDDMSMGSRQVRFVSVKQGVAEGLNEMGSEGYSGSREKYRRRDRDHRDGSHVTDLGKKKEGTGKMVKPSDVAKDAKEKLDKAMDKAHKSDVKEGQEDLEAILRIIKK